MRLWRAGRESNAQQKVHETVMTPAFVTKREGSNSQAERDCGSSTEISTGHAIGSR